MAGGTPDLSAQSVVWLAITAGALAGLGEALQRTAYQYLTHAPSAGFYWELYWMAPLSSALGAFAFGGILATASRLCGARLGMLQVVFVFAFTTIYAVVQLRGIPLHWGAEVLLSLGVAAVVAQSLTRRVPHLIENLVTNRRRWIVGILSMLMVAGLAGNDGLRERRSLWGRVQAGSELPNIILIILDTVRAANLSLYGYDRPTTPTIDAWAGGGVVFERAYATSSWTLPSHASMFTGRHGFELNTGFRRALDATYPTLAEVLAEHGYVTGGFVANTSYASRMSGLDRGFDRYEAIPVNVSQFVQSSWISLGLVRHLPGLDGLLGNIPKTANDITGAFTQWSAIAGERPFFAFLNFLDAHAPYEPPEPYPGIFGPLPQEGWDHVFNTWGLHPDSTYDEARLQLWKNRYDGGIRYIDDQLASMFQELQSRGILENTIVIVASDHGEMWGEYGQIDHATSLYSPLLHVPLALSWPGHIPAGRRIEIAVSTQALPATLLDLIGLAGEHELGGTSFASLWDSAAGAPPVPPILAELGLYPKEVAGWAPGVERWAPAARGPIASIIEGPYQYVRNGDGGEQLFDIGSEPLEATDLAGRPEYSETLGRLRTRLDSIRAAP